jgi:YbbR domain-containing protein
MARPVIPALQEFRRSRLALGQARSVATVLRAIALGRLPGGQRLSRRAVVTRLLASLLLAVALWLYTTGQENPVVSHTFTLQVVPRNLPSNLAIRNALPTVAVIASGLQSSFSGAGALSAYVNLAAISPSAGETTVPVHLTGERSDLQYTINPPSVLLELERQQTKKVPVIFNPQSSLNTTLEEIGDPQISPLLVTVSGPASVVSQLNNSATVSAPLNTVAAPPSAGASPFTVPLNLSVQLVDKHGNPVNDPRLTISPPEVTVTLEVAQRFVARNLTVIPLTTLQPPAGYVLGPQAPQANPATIFVLGVPQALNTVQTVTTEPIDISAITHSMTVTTHILLPPNVIAFATNGGTLQNSDRGPVVQVYITVTKQKTQATLYAQVLPTHLGAGLHATMSPQWVNVYVSGAAVDIAHVTALQGQVNLGGLPAGTYTVPVHVTMPRTLPRYAIAPASVQVTITGPPPKKR